jgi:hypothetical protein
MKKILRTTIVCLLIPSFVFAQIPQFGANESSVKPTDLASLWNALNTEVGQQIVSYIETTVGNIDLKHAKAFTTAKGEVAFVPIKSFSKVLAALCYRQLGNGSEYLFLITYNAEEKGVSFTFPSGRMKVMKSSGVTESANPDFQFQQYDDLSNNVEINDLQDWREIFAIICEPVASLAYISIPIAAVVYALIFWKPPCMCGGGWRPICTCDPRLVKIAFALSLTFPVLFIAFAYSFPDFNFEILKVLSIIFAAYYYGCVLALGDSFWMY